jgi:hypothetical protein
LTSGVTISKANLKKVASIVIKSKEAQFIYDKMDINSERQSNKLYFIEGKVRDELTSLLLAPKLSLQQFLLRNCYWSLPPTG